MTLIYESDLDILMTYLHIKNEMSKSRLSKVRASTGQTHRWHNTRPTGTHYHAAFVDRPIDKSQRRAAAARPYDLCQWI